MKGAEDPITNREREMQMPFQHAFLQPAALDTLMTFRGTGLCMVVQAIVGRL
jgi:hypothetical protein